MNNVLCRSRADVTCVLAPAYLSRYHWWRGAGCRVSSLAAPSVRAFRALWQVGESWLMATQNRSSRSSMI